MKDQNQDQQQTQTGESGAAGQGGQQQQQGQQDPKVGQAFAAQRDNLQNQANQEMNQLRNEVNQLQNQLALYQANMAMGPHTPPPRSHEPPPDPIKTVLGDDLRDDDPITVEDMRKILAMHEQGLQNTVQTLQFQMQAPDYNEVVQEHLPEILKTDPSVRQTLSAMRHQNPQGARVFAYQLCKMRSQHLKQGQSDQQTSGGEPEPRADLGQQARQIMEHMTNPGTAGLSNAGGAGGSHSPADTYRNMSDDELEARIAQVKARG